MYTGAHLYKIGACIRYIQKYTASAQGHCTLKVHCLPLTINAGVIRGIQVMLARTPPNKVVPFIVKNQSHCLLIQVEENDAYEYR